MQRAPVSGMGTELVRLVGLCVGDTLGKAHARGHHLPLHMFCNGINNNRTRTMVFVLKPNIKEASNVTDSGKVTRISAMWCHCFFRGEALWDRDESTITFFLRQGAVLEAGARAHLHNQQILETCFKTVEGTPQ
eukprot:5026932-Amphidinium_carterae.1